MTRRTFMQSIGVAVPGEHITQRMASCSQTHVFASTQRDFSADELTVLDMSIVYGEPMLASWLLASQVKRVESKDNDDGTYTHSFVFQDTSG